MEKADIKKDWLIAMALAFICLAGTIIFFHPVLNSDDDVFLMYKLAGGYGDTPTNLLHYDHILHPWLGYILSTLFTWLPHLNWYSWFFIGCQFFSWILIGRSLLFLLERPKAIGVFLLLFLLGGINGLQSLNMTSTTWMLSLAVSVYLVCFPKAILFCFVLLLISGSIRLQVPLMVLALFIPLQWIKGSVARWKPLFFLVAVSASFFLLNYTQKKYYEQHIPGWKAEERMKQDLFYAFNRPKNFEKPDSLIFQDSTEKAFYNRLFLYDDSFPSPNRIKNISRSITRIRDLSQKEDKEELYWTWVAWRLYLLYALVAILLAWKQAVLLSWLKRVWLPVLSILLFYIFLFVFLKFTDAFFIGIILMIALQLVLLWPKQPGAPASVYLPAILFLLPLTWSLNRDIQNDKHYRAASLQFKCGVEELKLHKQQLFIATGDALPVNFFPFNEVPADHSLENYVYKERLLTRSYFNSFRKYGLTGNLKMEITAPVLRFAGPYFPELLNWAGADSLVFSATDSSFHCLEIRKLLVK